jgi:peptide/nickel transport system substrate-binding protein
MLALAAACAREAPRAAILRIPIINEPLLDPILAPDIGSVMINKVLFPGLVRPDEALRPTPDLALSWTVSEDGCTYTFALRPGVRWHDGAPFTARDVQFTFERISDEPGSRQRSDFAAIARVEAVDSLTVRFTLKRPFAPFLALLGYNAGIIPEHLLRGKRLAVAAEFNRVRPIGTGPFMVREIQPGSAVTLVANPAYYGGRPKLDGIVFKLIPDVNAQVAQLRADELDMVPIEPANLSNVQQAPGLRVLDADAVQHYYVSFNQRRPAFKSPVVRRALDRAVDRNAIIAGVLHGHATAPRGTIPAVLREYYDTTVAPARYDTADALRLLADAGWRRGADGKLRDAAGLPFRFTLLVDKGNPTREQAALAVQQDLGRIGITAEIRTMEFTTLVRDYVLKERYDAVLIWWTTPPDPDQFAFYATGEVNNNGGYSNPTADSLLKAGRETGDPARRREIYAAFQRLEAEDPPVLVLYYPKELVAVRDRLQGVPALAFRDALRYTERFSLDASRAAR